MSNHEKDHNHLSPALELSQEEVRKLFEALARVIIRKGNISDTDVDCLPPQPGKGVKVFSVPIPKEVIKAIYLPKEIDSFVRDDACISYTQEHMVTGSDNVFSELWISFIYVLGDSKVQADQFTHIISTENGMEVEIGTEYGSTEGKVININTLEEYQGNSINDAFKMLAAQKEMNKTALELDDAMRLRKLLDYIETVPTAS